MKVGLVIAEKIVASLTNAVPACAWHTIPSDAGERGVFDPTGVYRIIVRVITLPGRTEWACNPLLPITRSIQVSATYALYPVKECQEYPNGFAIAQACSQQLNGALSPDYRGVCHRALPDRLDVRCRYRF